VKVPKIFLKFNKVDYKNNKNLMFLHQKCIFRKKKFPKSLSVQKLLVPLQPQISKVVFAQMAESVDALVSNTSGAIHPGSIPGLGTKKERSELLSFFRLYTLLYICTYNIINISAYILSYPPLHENVYSDLFRISLSIFGFSKDNIYLCRRNNLYIITQQTKK
jgi:hypothetical protein